MISHSLLTLILGMTSHLDAFSGYSCLLSYSTVPLAGELIYHWQAVQSPLVLLNKSFSVITPITQRNQTVSQRFEPSSSPVLMVEQTNPS